MQQKNYQQEILALIHSGLPQAELAEKLSDYHENDLADALAALTPDERQKLYAVLGVRISAAFNSLNSRALRSKSPSCSSIPPSCRASSTIVISSSSVIP